MEPGQNITIDLYNIEVVKNFIYLGSEITSRNVNWIRHPASHGNMDLKTADEKYLLVFERKILRTIYGPVRKKANGEYGTTLNFKNCTNMLI